MYRKDPAERFWNLVQKGDSCWQWTGSCKDAGYGEFKIDGKLVGAHRWIYEQTYGKIGSEFHVRHVCHNPGCVNPSHLYASRRKHVSC